MATIIRVQNKVVTIAARAAVDPWFLSLASIPYTAALVFLPHGLKLAVVVSLQGPRYNNKTPRYTDYEKDLPKVSHLVKRLTSCHQNSFEFFTLFAPAVLLAKVAKADGKMVRAICVKISVLRTLYMLLYIIGAWDVIAAMRTVVWLIATTLNFDLYRVALDL